MTLNGACEAPLRGGFVESCIRGVIVIMAPYPLTEIVAPGPRRIGPRDHVLFVRSSKCPNCMFSSPGDNEDREIMETAVFSSARYLLMVQKIVIGENGRLVGVLIPGCVRYCVE